MKKIVYYDLRHFCSAAKKSPVTPYNTDSFDFYLIETKKGILRYSPTRYHDGAAAKLLSTTFIYTNQKYCRKSKISNVC